MTATATAALLVIVFSIHCAVFAFLAVRRKRAEHTLFAVAFFALAASLVVRQCCPELEIWRWQFHLWLRFLAWVAMALASALFLKRWFFKNSP